MYTYAPQEKCPLTGHPVDMAMSGMSALPASKPAAAAAVGGVDWGTPIGISNQRAPLAANEAVTTLIRGPGAVSMPVPAARPLLSESFRQQ